MSTAEAEAWVRELDRLGEGLDREMLLEACLVGDVITHKVFLLPRLCGTLEIDSESGFIGICIVAAVLYRT